MSAAGRFFARLGWTFLFVACIVLSLQLLNVNGASVRGLLTVTIGLLFSAISLLTALVADRYE